VPGDLNVTGVPIVSGDYEARIAVSAWELDFWGRVRNLTTSALQEFLATDAARQAATLALISQVADSYLTLRELDERAALTQRTVASREESFRIFTRRFEVGSASRLELMQVETLLTQARSLGTQIDLARAQQAHALAQLVGVPSEIAPPSAALDAYPPFPELSAGLPSEVLLARPDIVAAERRLRAANADIGAARAAFFPRVTLTGALGSASAELDGLFESGSRAWSFVPALTLPLFDTGRRRAALDLATVRRDERVASYEQTVQNAFREVADALAARRLFSDQLQIQQIALNAQRERARLATLRYDSGAAPYLEVLDAQRDLLAAEQQLVQSRRALLSSHIALYLALGGGVSDLPALAAQRLRSSP
jgi:multidrug efflux system outer membrane protein